MGPGDEGDQPVMAQGPREEAGLAGDIGQHRHVELVLQQIMGELGGIADGEGELDAGIFPGEGGEGGGDVVGRIGPDAKMAFAQAPGGGEQMLRLGLQAEEPPGQIQELAAELRRHDLAAPPVEEADAEAFLQRLDLAGEGRLGHMEGGRSPGEAAFAGDGMKGAELGMIHRYGLCESREPLVSHMAARGLD